MLLYNNFTQDSKDNASLVIGIRRNQILFTPINDLIENTDFE